MSADPSLFDEPPDPHHLARADDPTTSHAAAASLRVAHITETRKGILAALEANPEGLTDEGIARAYKGPDASPSGLRTRRKELVDFGLVVASGRTERTRANRESIIWVLAKPGVAPTEVAAAVAATLTAVTS